MLTRATIAAACALIVTPAVAQNVHIVPDHANPTFNDKGLTLEATGRIAGLSAADVLVSLKANASVTATCTNPSGQNQPPGQNPAPISVSGSQAIPVMALKNGSAVYDVTTEAPTTPIPGAPGCPNPQWTESITDLSFTDATLTFAQNGVTELTVQCTFSPPTQNGLVPDKDVKCFSPPS